MNLNGIDKIIARIDGEADAQIAQVTDRARAEADAISARYAAQAEQQAAEILTRGRAAADERVERLQGVAGLEARKLTLAARQEMVDRAFDRAREQLRAMPQAQYVAFLAGLAAAAAVSGQEQVILSEADRAQVGAQVVEAANEQLAAAGRAHELTLSAATRPLDGGLILSEGNVETNCSISSLLRLQRGELAGQVAALLFAQ